MSPLALGEKAELLDLVLRATQDGIADWDLTSGVTRYNARWKHLLGFDDETCAELEESPHLLWRELLHAEDRPRLEQELKDHLDQDWPFIVTARMRHRHGPYRHILCRGTTLRDSNDRPVRMLITFADIDYQVRAEERQRALIQALPDTIFRLDSAGIVVGLKGGSEREGSPFSLLREGRRVSECLPESDLRTCLEQAVAGSDGAIEPGQVQSWIFSTGTAARPIFHELRLVRCDANEAVCMARDVTEQRALEERLRQSQKLESLGQLAAGVAHEINTPMQFIGDNLHFAKSAILDLLSCLDELKQKLAGAEDVPWRERALVELAELEAAADLDYARARLPEAIERSLSGVERVTKIVRAMKAFSHPGGRALAAARLNELIESTATVASNEWKYIADLTLDLDCTLPPVVCVGSEINQVLLNLIVNASHAIADVVGATGEKGQIVIRSRYDATHAEVRVEDSGTGIAADTQAKVFDPFFTTKEVGKGTGQGLSMAYQCIVGRHRGTLHFETKLGVGTTFIVRLPLSPQPSPASQPSA